METSRPMAENRATAANSLRSEFLDEVFLDKVFLDEVNDAAMGAAMRMAVGMANISSH